MAVWLWTRGSWWVVLSLVAAASCASTGESTGDDHVEPTVTAVVLGPQAVTDPPTLRDHWHIAYGVWNCHTGTFLDPFLSEVDPDGIHSHQDGLVHIHPFTSAVTGSAARLDVFLRNMGATLTDTKLALPGGQSLTEGGACGGEEAILQVVRWNGVSSLDSPTEIRTEALDGFRFLADGEVITLALAPEGSAVPPPPSLGQLPGVLGQSRDEGVDPPTG